MTMKEKTTGILLTLFFCSFVQDSFAQDAKKDAELNLKKKLQENRNVCKEEIEFERNISKLSQLISNEAVIKIFIEEIREDVCETTLTIILNTISELRLYNSEMARTLWLKLGQITNETDNFASLINILCQEEFCEHSRKYFVAGFIMLPNEHKIIFSNNYCSNFSVHFKTELFAILLQETDAQIQSELIRNIEVDYVDKKEKYLKFVRSQFKFGGELIKAACAYRILNGFAHDVPVSFFNDYYKQNIDNLTVVSILLDGFFQSRFASSLLPTVIKKWADLIKNPDQPKKSSLLSLIYWKTAFIKNNIALLNKDQINLIKSQLEVVLDSARLALKSIVFDRSLKVFDYSKKTLSAFEELRRSSLANRRISIRFIHCEYWKSHPKELEAILVKLLSDPFPQVISSTLFAINAKFIHVIGPEAKAVIEKLANSENASLAKLSNLIIDKVNKN